MPFSSNPHILGSPCKHDYIELLQLFVVVVEYHFSMVCESLLVMASAFISHMLTDSILVQPPTSSPNIATHVHSFEILLYLQKTHIYRMRSPTKMCCHGAQAQQVGIAHTKHVQRHGNLHRLFILSFPYTYMNILL